MYEYKSQVESTCTFVSVNPVDKPVLRVRFVTSAWASVTTIGLYLAIGAHFEPPLVVGMVISG
jgi:hypothetical protein